MYNVAISDIISDMDIESFIGDKTVIVNEVIKLDEKSTNISALSWCNDKNKEKLQNISKGTIIIGDNIEKEYLNSNCNYIVVENPRRSFQEILTKFFVKKHKAEVASTASIDLSTIIGENVFIGHNVVVEANCKIGDNSVIKHNTVVFEDTIIGNNVIIGANNTIGGIGFGYEKDTDGDFQLIPHLGNVVIHNNVDIGNNSAVDRAVLGSTILEENVKIDNLVHIAHGVHIKRNSVIIANSMVAGSVVIGENTWVAPSASILNQKSIGANSLVGMGAVVLKDVDDYVVVAGSPAKVLKKLK